MSLAEIRELSQEFARSGYFRDALKPEQAFTKLMLGREFDLGPWGAMTGVQIVSGKPELAAVVMAGIVKRSERYDYSVDKHDEKGCSISFYAVNENGKRDAKPIGVSTFTIDDAKHAGLASGPVWSKYARNMLWARAMSNGATWFCPDVFGGPVYSYGEISPSDINDVPTETTEGVDEPAPEPTPEPLVEEEPTQEGDAFPSQNAAQKEAGTRYRSLMALAESFGMERSDANRIIRESGVRQQLDLVNVDSKSDVTMFHRIAETLAKAADGTKGESLFPNEDKQPDNGPGYGNEPEEKGRFAGAPSVPGIPESWQPKVEDPDEAIPF